MPVGGPAGGGGSEQQVGPDDAGTTRWASCAVCGATEHKITGSLQVDGRGATWLCELCTRKHLRSIEGRLDEAWW